MNETVMPAKAGISGHVVTTRLRETPACAGVTLMGAS